MDGTVKIQTADGTVRTFEITTLVEILRVLLPVLIQLLRDDAAKR
jgi:hypothetical protein